MEEEDLFYTLALTKVIGVGPIIGKRLIEHFGSAKGVFQATPDACRLKRVSEGLITNLQEVQVLRWAEKELKLIQKLDILPLYYRAPTYPFYLKQCDDAPLLLFYKGTKLPDWTSRPILSVVGTRTPTPRGMAFCAQIMEVVQPFNPIVISGLAYGIDACVHREALAFGLETFGILGHGLQRIYPAIHAKLAKQMMRQGGLLTEFPIQSRIERENFVQRNRIVAGMSQATIVVESALKGGSMSSIGFANEYNRDAFAVPGRVDDLMSQGCNELIRTLRAQLLQQPSEIIDVLNWNRTAPKTKVVQPQLFVHLEEEAQRVFDYLCGVEREVIDLIAIECNLPIYKVSTLLLQLELQGLVKPLPGKYFERLN
ncbi:DNA-protecting protein DprA [Myroides sp. DF42-4-2]|uniref:DNA-processing protein DprA n=1 Tax=unclassified Myroides TaxID=2642485 RepID=UPI002578EC6D|nr:DNA-protecting protein DprA [Myroides sp. DF42-4-2]MDM1406063.1 DNA-processing protein DprA [Myroides sp. DF42-4-2]